MIRDYFIDDLRLVAEIINDRDIVNTAITRRVKFFKTRKNPLEELDERDFQLKYRFAKITALFIIDLLKNDLAGDARGGFIPPHIKVLAAVRTWARGEVQDDAGDINGMSQPTISLVCKQVALALVRKRDQFIAMPKTETEQNAAIAKFFAICGFRQVIGAIDCTHIRIPKIKGDIGQYYINRKGYSSINVQVVSNADLRIMDIVAHWRGSTHDSRIFNECSLKHRFQQSEFKGKLLGDSGYGCTPYLFTPVLNPTTDKEDKYNWAHIRTRNPIERCFGVWKQRFRCLQRGFTTKLENTKLYIIALAILHNIALQQQDNFPETVILDACRNEPVTVAPVDSLRGNAFRAAFINENF